MFCSLVEHCSRSVCIYRTSHSFAITFVFVELYLLADSQLDKPDILPLLWYPLFSLKTMVGWWRNNTQSVHFYYFQEYWPLSRQQISVKINSCIITKLYLYTRISTSCTCIFHYIIYFVVILSIFWTVHTQKWFSYCVMVTDVDELLVIFHSINNKYNLIESNLLKVYVLFVVLLLFIWNQIKYLNITCVLYADVLQARLHGSNDRDNATCSAELWLISCDMSL